MGNKVSTTGSISSLKLFLFLIRFVLNVLFSFFLLFFFVCEVVGLSYWRSLREVARRSCGVRG